ncbi:hypothetical protein Pcinc_038901, partial [Petrolisthes cinctipes]
CVSLTSNVSGAHSSFTQGPDHDVKGRRSSGAGPSDPAALPKLADANNREYQLLFCLCCGCCLWGKERLKQLPSSGHLPVLRLNLHWQKLRCIGIPLNSRSQPLPHCISSGSMVGGPESLLDAYLV